MLITWWEVEKLGILSWVLHVKVLADSSGVCFWRRSLRCGRLNSGCKKWVHHEFTVCDSVLVMVSMVFGPRWKKTDLRSTRIQNVFIWMDLQFMINGELTFWNQMFSVCLNFRWRYHAGRWEMQFAWWEIWDITSNVTINISIREQRRKTVWGSIYRNAWSGSVKCWSWKCVSVSFNIF